MTTVLSLLGWVLRGLLGLLILTALVACAQYVRNSGTPAVPQQAPESLRVATLNVHWIALRRATGDWSVADWEARKGPLDEALKTIAPDIIGFQEMESFGGGSMSRENLALDYLLAQNPDLGAAAQGDPARFPSTQPIFYRKDRLGLVEEGWFFFSDTPDVIYSRTFNGSFPAFASWALFEDRSGARVRVINMHTDFASRSNRQQSAALVAERAEPWIAAGERVVVLGDMNARAGARTLQIMEGAGFTFLPIDGATFHFNRGLNLFGAIDHIGVAGPIATGPTTVVRDQFGGRWPTDHYPVLVDLTLEAP